MDEEVGSNTDKLGNRNKVHSVVYPEYGGTREIPSESAGTIPQG
ncbi:hypothetical protein CMALT394_910001 [Carnobacterium maltaromaticum]|nr:hypothetical protein CMALT394_910001 [Carnobacterium maltaromaticum]